MAAKVGGIGANRERPAEFFYDNLMMSVPLLHESWRRGIAKFVALDPPCIPEICADSLSGRVALGRVPGRDHMPPTGWPKK